MHHVPQVKSFAKPLPGTGIAYLDHAAGGTMGPAVVTAMFAWVGEPGNSHSDHNHGRAAMLAVEEARESVAKLIDADSRDIYFTSGATEANNLVLLGAAKSSGFRGATAVSGIDHRSLLEPAKVIQAERGDVHFFVPDRHGCLSVDDVGKWASGRMDQPRGLLATSHANSELGSIEDIEALSRLAHSAGHFFHLDASQTLGRVPISVTHTEIDSLSIASHKIGGPSGIGAVYLTPDFRKHIRPISYGGGQEGGVRPGTVPTFLAVGLGAAAEQAHADLSIFTKQMEICASVLLAALRASHLRFERLGHPQRQLPGHLSLRFEGVNGLELAASVSPYISISTGSACQSTIQGPSFVLTGVGMTEEEAAEVVRVTFGRGNTTEHALQAADAITRAVIQIVSRKR